MELRPYQNKIITDLREGFKAGHRRQMLALATGGGKTAIASQLIRNSTDKGNKASFIVDRIELVGQAARHLEGVNLDVGILQGENTRLSDGNQVIVASIQTIRARDGAFNSLVGTIGLVIIDEAHMLHDAHVRLMNEWDSVPFIGLSATPLRKDLGKHFSSLVRGPTIKELMEQGYLVNPRIFLPSDDMREAARSVRTRNGDYAVNDLGAAVNTTELVGDVVETWKTKGEGRQTLCFAVNCEHSRSLVENFQRNGVEAYHLDFKTAKSERREFVEAFRNREIKILSSVNVLGIGFDVPGASCAIIARPTLSLALHIQFLGRVLRPCEGKDDALILDHAGNCLTHGSPENFRLPELGTDEVTKNKKRKDDEATKCPECSHLMDKGDTCCRYCAYEKPATGRKIITLHGSLEEVRLNFDLNNFDDYQKQIWYQGFFHYAESRGIKKGWAYHAFIEAFNERPHYEWRNLESIEPMEEQAVYLKQVYNYRKKAA